MSTDARTNLESVPPDATPGVRHGRFNAYAAYDEQGEAQDALVALGRAGFEGAAISLRGPEDAVTQEDTRHVDTRIISHWFRNIAVGGAIGAVIGFIAGMPVGAFIIGSMLERDVTISNVLVSGFFGALFISTILALWSLISSIRGGPAWEQSFQEQHGRRVIVGVHVNDQEDFSRALDVLQETNAVDSRISGEGGRQAAPGRMKPSA
ncbi:MAG TPA: hypothetical protein VMR52_06285 [Dehalococcoidia bacterium]|nr:hypothetical protein [Dehalococcoidia bacterium]